MGDGDQTVDRPAAGGSAGTGAPGAVAGLPLAANQQRLLAAAALETDGVHPGSIRSPAGVPEPGGVSEGQVIEGHVGAAGNGYPSNCRPNLTKNSRFTNGLVGATAETAFIEFAQHQTCQLKCFQRQAANPNHH